MIFYYLKSPQYILLFTLRTLLWMAYLSNFLSKSFHSFWVKRIISEFCASRAIRPDVVKDFHDHQTCHAYSAFFLSSFVKQKKVIVFTLDEQGDEAYSKAFVVENKKFNLIGTSPTIRKKINGTYHTTSIGSIYSNFTEALGFIRSSDEGKVEALAAFGKASEELLTDLLETIKISKNSFIINEKLYWKYVDPVYLASLRELHGDENLACTIQTFLEEIVTKYLTLLQNEYKADYLCVAGGVTANVIMNL